MENYILTFFSSPEAIKMLIMFSMVCLVLAISFLIFWVQLCREIIQVHLPNKTNLAHLEDILNSEMKFLMLRYYTTIKDGGAKLVLPVLNFPSRDFHFITKNSANFLNEIMLEDPTVLAKRMAVLKNQYCHDELQKLVGKPLITSKKRV